MVRPSRLINRKLITLVALALAMFLIATNVQAGLLYLVSSALLGLIVISYFVPWWSVRGLRVERRAPAEAFENIPITLEAIVRNQGRRPRALVSVRDGLAPGVDSAAAWVPGRGEIVISYETALPRGLYPEASLAVSCAAPFGIWTARRTATVAGTR